MARPLIKKPVAVAAGAAPKRAHIPTSVQARINELKVGVTTRQGVKLIKDFAIFIDTHRDHPHVGTFFDDIHRGFCRPTKVDYIVWDPVASRGDLLLDPVTGRTLVRHDKHLFVTEEWFAQFLIGRMISGETDPRDGDGVMATSHLRDARAKVYLLKSFRQVVFDRWVKEHAKP